MSEVWEQQFLVYGSVCAHTCEAPWASLCSALCVCLCVCLCTCVCVVERWGTEEVGVWLEQLSLGEYRDTFIRHDIRGSELLHLERRDLKVHTHACYHTSVPQWICVNPLVQPTSYSFSLSLALLYLLWSFICQMSPCFATSCAALHCSAWLILSDCCLVKETCCNPLTLCICWRGEAYRAGSTKQSWADCRGPEVQIQAVSVGAIFKLAQLGWFESCGVYRRLKLVGVFAQMHRLPG